MADQPSREVQILKAVLQLGNREERAAYLRGACAGDAALLECVEARLRAHEQAGTSFDPDITVKSDSSLDRLLVEPVTEKPGDWIGRYKLLQEIGEGGCGTVYMAEQEEPVRRRVALKVIKLGMDTKQVVARFEAERQALALMDHPNIAKVLDGGATDTGRPFFVMELVRGVPITEYCDQNNLSTQQRLELFIHVCKAIQHAHQKGIIHRDIKPSNILVSLHDSAPVPKVIDFGIAKAIDQPLTEKTLFTRFEQFMGTPAYMSPEQAGMSGLEIDTRADIYGLGVLLYELLTGKTPFDSKRLVEAGLDEIRRIIREEEPTRPSTRISTLDASERDALAKRRGSESPGLIHMVAGDLDWIVMKAMDKDRTRRYETANGLAMDVTRFLGNEPIEARPPSNLYRFQKLVRRHRLAFAVAAAILVMMLIGIVVSTWQAIRARRAEQLANQQRERAEQEARKSRDVLEFVRSMFSNAGRNYAADKVTVLEMLDMSAADADKRFHDQPDALATIEYSVGYYYSRIAKWDQARQYFEKALQLQAQLFGPKNSDTLYTEYELGSIALSQGRTEDGKAFYLKVLTSSRDAEATLLKDGPGGQWSIFHALETRAGRRLVDIFINDRDFQQAKPLIDQILASMKAGELNGFETGSAWEGLGNLDLEEGRPQDALKNFETAITYYEPYHDPVSMAWVEGLRGAAYLAMGDYPQAEPLITNDLPILQERFGDSHFRVQRAFRDLVSLYTKTGRLNQAAEWRKKINAPPTVR